MEHKKNLVSYSVLFSGIFGTLICLGYGAGDNILAFMLGVLAVGGLVVYPIVLTLLNLFFLIVRVKNPVLVRQAKYIEYITLVLGVLYTVLILPFLEIQLKADWTEILANRQVHTPVWVGGQPTILVLACLGLAGYLFLSWVNICKVPPLLCVFAISGMYLGVAICLVWIVQVFSERYFLLCVLPFNYIVLAAKTVRYKVGEWQEQQREEVKEFKNPKLNAWNQKLLESRRWPAAAFFFMWPLLGITVAVLLLFGQRPDSIIRAWTETSDWNLSAQSAPQNIYYDEHYLCTVAAGGHRKLVKPIRMGIRHGHPVIVNRQLCVANAFEELLQECFPSFHRGVRGFYDRFGFPIARWIRSPYIADGIYLLMKPLEWLFLGVLYCYDVNPENRIAVQYLPKYPDFERRV